MEKDNLKIKDCIEIMKYPIKPVGNDALCAKRDPDRSREASIPL